MSKNIVPSTFPFQLLKKRIAAVIEARVESIDSIASLVNKGKCKRIIRIANKGLREGKSHLKQNGYSMIKRLLERFCLSIYANQYFDHQEYEKSLT